MHLYTCSLKELKFQAFHGLYPEEQLTGTLFSVDVSISAFRTNEDELNTLQSVFNYETIYAVVKQVMAEREDLIETVAKKLLNKLQSLAENGVEKIEVVIRKPNPGGVFKSGYAEIRLSHGS